MTSRWFLVLLAVAAWPGFGISSGCGENDEPEPVWIQETESNNIVSEANPIGLYTYVTGSMEPGDSDVFLLTIPGDFDAYKVTLSVTDDPGDCFTGVDPNLELRDADGVTVLDWVEDSIDNYCPELQFVPRAGGTYYVIVSTAYTLTGDYVLSVFPGGTGTISGTVVEPPADVGANKVGVASSRPATPLFSRQAAKLAPRQRSPIAIPSDGGTQKGESSRREVAGGDSREGTQAGVALVAGEAIIRVRPRNLPPGFGDRLSQAVHLPLAWVRPILGGRYYLAHFTLPRDLDGPARSAATRRLVADIRSMDGVVSADPNGLLYPAVLPDDEFFSDQWGLRADHGIDVEDAWDWTTGRSDVVVAVIDTGDDPDHPDLMDKSVPGFDFISDPDNAGDWNGVDPDPEDNLLQSHGAHVAGIAAADTDNGLGVAGVGWQSSYMPLRVCGNYGCTYADVIEAIGYAAGLETVAGPGLSEARADVINLSLGANDRCPGPVQDAITSATYRGVVVVVAAGNGGEDASVFTPANCEDVIAVGATDEWGERTDFSNFGTTVDVYAPGNNILSTLVGGGYGTMSGTSMATPHVSGIVALIMALSPTFSTSSVRDLLTATCPADGCVDPVDAADVLERALSAPFAADDLPPLILVKAVDITDPDRAFYTFARDGHFVIEGVEPGTYQVQAGTDPDGDFVLGEPSEWFGVFPGIFEVTDLGEDAAGLEIDLVDLGD